MASEDTSVDGFHAHSPPSSVSGDQLPHDITLLCGRSNKVSPRSIAMCTEFTLTAKLARPGHGVEAVHKPGC